MNNEKMSLPTKKTLHYMTVHLGQRFRSLINRKLINYVLKIVAKSLIHFTPIAIISNQSKKHKYIYQLEWGLE